MSQSRLSVKFWDGTKKNSSVCEEKSDSDLEDFSAGGIHINTSKEKSSRDESNVPSKTEKVNFVRSLKGQDFPCPLLISLSFSSNQLEKITLEKSSEFALLFSEKQPKEEAIIDWFNMFFQRISTPFPLPLKAQLGNFTWEALRQLQQIPAGQTASYRDIAIQLNNPSGARAVGNACKHNPFPLVIPCHRIIKTDGSLGGFAFGLELKQMLLDFEATTHTKREK